MSDRTPLIVGNWKMNGLRTDGSELANELCKKIGHDENFEVLVCPPSTLVSKISEVLATSPIAVGGQDCHANEKGAHTGDVSAVMLADAGCSYVIVGHSERRTGHGEDDATVRAKASTGLLNGLKIVICVGETESQKDAGDTLSIVSSQVSGSLPEGATAENTVVAYEPVWAIGTGRTPTLEEVQEVHAAIRADINIRLGVETANGMRLLYGGSVKPENASDLLALNDVDGALVGGASLDAEQFWAIAQSCS